MAESKLTPDVLRECIGRAAAGESAESISRWLRTDRGVDLSARTLRARLAKTRQERGDVAKIVVRETLSRTLNADLAALEKQRTRLLNLCTRAYKAASADEGAPEPKAVRVYLDALNGLTRVVDMKLHYAGADSPDVGSEDVAEASRTLVGRLAGLAERLGARSDAEDDRVH